MTASNKVSPSNNNTIIHGHNYAALLSHEEMPSKFHVIQGFLALIDIGFALINPVKISYKAGVQVWDSVKYDTESGAFTFEVNDELFEITHDVGQCITSSCIGCPS